MADLDTTGMRERILDRATDLFVRQGYNGISMREIAEECGLSKAGLYYHYKDKEDLFLAILSESLNTLEQLIDAVEAQEQKPTEQIRLFIRAIFTHIQSGRRSVIRLASQEADKITPEARAAFHRRYEEQFLGRIQRILDEGIRAGDFRPMDTRLGVWSLLGLMYPFMNQESAVEQVVPVITMIFLEGVRQKS